jgi:hypothetical protein
MKIVLLLRYGTTVVDAVRRWPKLRYAAHDYTYIYTGCTQKNVAVSKVNKKFISHLTCAQRTP